MKALVSRPRLPELAVLIAFVAASVAFALHAGRNTSWDQKNYHYYGGYALLHKPLLYDFAPAQVQTFFNPLFHLPTYLMLKHLPTRATAAILAALQGLNFWLVYKISRKVLADLLPWSREVLSLAAAAAAFYGAVNLSELGTTFGDNLVSVLPLAALWLILDRLPQRPDSGRRKYSKLVWGGLIAGAACGLKLTVAIYVIPLAVVLLGFTVARRVSPKGLAAFYAGIALGFIAAYGFWGWALYREYGNPFYPYLNNIFRSEYYDLENTMDPRFLPRDWSQKLFYPFYFTKRNTLVSEPPFRDLRFAVCYLMLLAIPLYAALRRLGGRSGPRTDRGPSEAWRSLAFLAPFMALSYLLWQCLFSIYRYAVVLEFLAPVFITLALVCLFCGRPVAVLLALALDALVCFTLVPLDFGREPFREGDLAVRPPPWSSVTDSVVLMGGDEATAYVAASFPDSTRFVRIEGNWLYPGRNTALDAKIRGILASYPVEKTLAYASTEEELHGLERALQYYGVGVDDGSCAPVEGIGGGAGYLCRASATVKPPAKPAPPPNPNEPVFTDQPGVALVAAEPVVRAARDTLVLKVVNLPVRAVDVLYTLDGALMPPVRNWYLEKDHALRVFVSTSTPKGAYHIIGIRDSNLPAGNQWIRVDATVRVR
jgi:hypothetical protein